MFNIIKDKLSFWSNNGIRFLYAFDATTGQPSVTLFFSYVTFWLAICGSVAVYFKSDLLFASINSIVFWILAFVMYRIRHLDKFKLDLDDRSLELSGDDDEQK